MADHSITRRSMFAGGVATGATLLLPTFSAPASALPIPHGPLAVTDGGQTMVLMRNSAPDAWGVEQRMVFDVKRRVVQKLGNAIRLELPTPTTKIVIKVWHDLSVGVPYEPGGHVDLVRCEQNLIDFDADAICTALKKRYPHQQIGLVDVFSPSTYFDPDRYVPMTCLFVSVNEGPASTPIFSDPMEHTLAVWRARSAPTVPLDWIEHDQVASLLTARLQAKFSPVTIKTDRVKSRKLATFTEFPHSFDYGRTGWFISPRELDRLSQAVSAEVSNVFDKQSVGIYQIVCGGVHFDNKTMTHRSHFLVQCSASGGHLLS